MHQHCEKSTSRLFGWHHAEKMRKKETKSVAELLNPFHWLPCSNPRENTSSQKRCYVGVLENIWDFQGTHSFSGIHWSISESDKRQCHSHLSKFKWKTEQSFLKQTKLSYLSLSFGTVIWNQDKMTSPLHSTVPVISCWFPAKRALPPTLPGTLH